MYSSFCYQELKELDKDKLKEVKDSFDKEDDWSEIIEEDGSIDFEAWCGYKIEAYWNPETIEILKAIAPFVEGFAEFMYEEGYKFRIYFENSKVFIKTAEEVDWEKIQKRTFD